MSKNKKGMICLLNSWEHDIRGVSTPAVDCRNHKHLSRRRACERFGISGFADRILAHVYDNGRHELLGFIVAVADRAEWFEKQANQDGKFWIPPAWVKKIEAHTYRLQALINDQHEPFEVIELPMRRGNSFGSPPRDALVSESLRSHSSSGITARESESNAEWYIDRRGQPNKKAKP
jgi:hypothetical protein